MEISKQKQIQKNIHQVNEPLIVGDFNFHVDDLEKESAASFIDILNTFKLKQHVTFPTHVKGHTLDLVITLDNDDAVSRIRKGDQLSDHVSVLCDILCYKPPPTTKNVTYRCIRKIDIDQFKQDIQCLDLGCPENSTEELVCKYNHSLRQLLDKHAPLKSRTVIVRPKRPWLSESLKLQRSELRKLERRWRKNANPEDWASFTRCRKSFSDSLTKTKEDYYQNIIMENKMDQKKLFQLTKSLLQETSETPLPPHHTHGELANNFSDFFMSKISKIRDQFTNSDNKESDDIPFSGESFFQCFRSLSEDDVLELLKKTPTKSSDLDPIPTYLLKRCSDALAPAIRRIINASLSRGEVTSYLSNRSQKVSIAGAYSVSRFLECCVPQGSVLGPQLYSQYTRPIGDIIRSSGLLFHLFLMTVSCTNLPHPVIWNNNLKPLIQWSRVSEIFQGGCLTTN